MVTLENSLEQLQRTVEQLMQGAQERVKPVPLSGGVADEQQSRIVTLENAMEQMQRTLQQMQRTLEQSMHGAQERVKPVLLSGGMVEEQQRRMLTLENANEQMQRTLEQMQRTLEQMQRTPEQSMQGAQERVRPVLLSDAVAGEQQHSMFTLEKAVERLERLAEQSTFSNTAKGDARTPLYQDLEMRIRAMEKMLQSNQEYERRMMALHLELATQRLTSGKDATSGGTTSITG